MYVFYSIGSLNTQFNTSWRTALRITFVSSMVPRIFPPLCCCCFVQRYRLADRSFFEFLPWPKIQDQLSCNLLYACFWHENSTENSLLSILNWRIFFKYVTTFAWNILKFDGWIVWVILLYTTFNSCNLFLWIRGIRFVDSKIVTKLSLSIIDFHFKQLIHQFQTTKGATIPEFNDFFFFYQS